METESNDFHWESHKKASSKKINITPPMATSANVLLAQIEEPYALFLADGTKHYPYLPGLDRKQMG
jgi:hypothetical protein